MPEKVSKNYILFIWTIRYFVIYVNCVRIVILRARWIVFARATNLNVLKLVSKSNFLAKFTCKLYIKMSTLNLGPKWAVLNYYYCKVLICGKSLIAAK